MATAAIGRRHAAARGHMADCANLSPQTRTEHNAFALEACTPGLWRIVPKHAGPGKASAEDLHAS